MSNNSTRVCKDCGKAFRGNRDCLYCPDCAKKRRSDVIRIRVCKDCGVEFYGGPRASRCPNCAEYARTHHANGPAKRPIGSIDKCQICGSEYIVTGGRSKYCSPACARIGLLQYQCKRKKIYNQQPEVKIKKIERRQIGLKLCPYCHRSFLPKDGVSTNYCSDFCKHEQRLYYQCISDINRGRKRDISKYEERRQKYRDAVAEEQNKT